MIAERLAESLDNHTEFGVWGGMTERQRRALLNRRPEVVSWRELFEAERMREQRHASTGDQRDSALARQGDALEA